MLEWFDFTPPFTRRGVGLVPYVRIEDYVDDGHYVVRAELPGIDPDNDVELSLRGDTLTIRGERREEERTRHHHEFHYGAFERSVPVPAGTRAEDILADYAGGVLEIRVPISDTGAGVHRIPVRRTSG
jgi:HSP20 family molecular chaperone IbpA